jgi:CSLREA domain-containing protein
MKKQHHQPRRTKSFNLNYRKPGWRLAVRCSGLFATLALALATAPRASANITVTSLNDSGPGSLREAIADGVPGDTIDFTVSGTITLTNGELVITNDLTISGPGVTNLTVSGNDSSRVFSVVNATVSIAGVAVSQGQAWGGGAVYIDSTSTLTMSNCSVTASADTAGNYSGGGGGIMSEGTLTIINSTISGNTSAIYAGGILSVGNLTLINSTVCCNYGGNAGGGIYQAGSQASLVNCTISGNSILYGNGGGLMGVFTCTNCTISANHGYYFGGGFRGSVTLHNTVIAGNFAVTGPDGYGSIISQDYNLIQDTGGCTISGVTTHNIYGKDPLLGPLADNGGPTPTHALLPGSWAIDQGSSGGLTTDQRGQPRPFRFPYYIAAADGSDIGAYELQERPQTGPVFTVNSNDDVDDGVPGIAHCSLREAVNAANANPGTNTINFAAAIPGLMNGVTGTITLTNGELAVTNSVNITGPGATNLTVSGNNASRVFNIFAPVVSITGLSIANGNAGLYAGGGVVINFGTTGTLSNVQFLTNSAGQGGAINNYGTLTVRDCVFADNVAYAGGAILNYPPGGPPGGQQLTVVGCTLMNNHAYEGGGGIYNESAAVSITNSTLSGNSSAGNYAGGGGFSQADGGTATINSSTICGNAAINAGGGILLVSQGLDPGPLVMHNTIVADNSAGWSAPDYSGTLNSQDYNLIQNTNGCIITNLTAHNIYNQDPLLGPLADNGGPTPTHALRYDSPAIDAGNSGGLTTDQRGMPRPIGTPKVEGGDGSDIGAYEADPNLCITGLGKTGGDIWLSFNSMFGRTYRVESTDELPPTWNVLTNGLPGTGGPFQVLDGGAASLPQRFYRTVLLLP